MAVPSYTTDLATTSADTTKGTIYRQDSTTALTTTGCLGTLTWGEPTGSAAGGLPTQDTDYFILGVATADKSFNATSVGGLGVGTTNAASLPTDGAFLFWSMFTCPNSIANQASGGIQVVIGNTLANYKRFYVAGDDTHPYGGWRCYAVNPSVTSSLDYGSPTSTTQYFGVVYNVDNAVSKGQPAALGAIRFGRCYTLCTGGESANYATFAGAYTFNNYNDGTNGWNRLGLVQYDSGTYKMQGLFQMGSSGATVDFRDSNKNIVIQNTEFVTSNFNTFEVQNASSRVDMTAISITALGTVSKGRWVTTDNATQNITNCTFTDMGTFAYASNSILTRDTYRSCGLVTQNGATLTGCTFDTPSGTALLSNNPAAISSCTFTSTGTGHAIELTSACAGNSYSFSGNNFTGYASTDGSTGNEVIYNNSGGAVTINYSGGSGVISVKNGAGASTSVASSVTLTIEIRDSDDGTLITKNCEVTIVKVSDESVLFHEDDILDGSTVYSYSSGSGTDVYINVLNIGDSSKRYQNKTVFISLPSGSETSKVFLDIDRIYSNP